MLVTRILNDGEIHPISTNLPILVDQYGYIWDGHHRYYSNLFYNTPLKVERVFLSPLFFIDYDRLIFTKDLNTHKQSDLETIIHMFVIIYKNFVIRLGNTRAYYMAEQNNGLVKCKTIIN